MLYEYHPLTKEFLGITQAQPHPFKENDFLIPAYTTDIAPPNLEAFHNACFLDGEWLTLPDYRGVSYWLEGVESKISELGTDLPEGASLTAPEPEEQPKDPVRQRAYAYADPITGSDRLLMEALRKEVLLETLADGEAKTALSAEIQQLKTDALARIAEIQTIFPL